MIQVLHGDAVTVVATLAPQSVHVCVTSPPYYGLRDYQTGTWQGGDPACPHTKDRAGGVASSTLTGGKVTTNHQQEAAYRAVCGACGAARVDAQLGLEARLDCVGWATGAPCGACYVCRLVAVFAAVKRVLRADGTLWCVVGDSYAGGQKGGPPSAKSTLARHGATGRSPYCDALAPVSPAGRGAGLRAKDLCNVPWRLALAMQAAGWVHRSTVIWHKPNAMPSSQQDRPTVDWEAVLLFAKGQRYYWDAVAVQEGSTTETTARCGPKQYTDGGYFRNGQGTTTLGPGRAEGRTLRAVWTLPTVPFSATAQGLGDVEHYAAFPPALVERCLRASCPPGGTVLDPFAGSGTTLLVAQRLGRHAVGIDLSAAYVQLARARCRQDAPLLFQEGVVCAAVT